MFNIYRSNRVETLLDLLAHRIREAPLGSPFTRELVIAPSPAMARWVHLGLARTHGIAANLAYPLPASFAWQLARDLLSDPPEGDDRQGREGSAGDVQGRTMPEQDPLAVEGMAWRIYGFLPGMLPAPAFAPLRHYLQPPDNALRRWQLAERIADAFDRYQLYRPDLIRAWSGSDARDSGGDAAGDDAWQRHLWRRLIDGVAYHRVAVIDRLLARLSTNGPCPALPERVTLFAVSSLPPLLVEVVQALATHTRVELYLHCPTDQFWADLVNRKVQARKRLERPEEADLWEIGNPLLSSWGRQGQTLQDLLLEREVPLGEADAWDPPTRDSVLHRLQHDIYTLTGPAADGSREAVAPDASLAVQVCHSALRECQVLHDRLLGMFEAEPDLTPEDCLVMIPEIDAYAPYIEAVFERQARGARPYIPWNLSDISLRDEHPLILVFLQLLDLPNSRFGRAEVLSYLDVRELAQTFGLDPEAVAQVKGWLAEARLRWGLDAAHKARLGLPGMAENTWAQVEQRLFGGYALAGTQAHPVDDAESLYAGIAPIPGVEGAGAQTLGRFWHLLTALQETAAALARPRPAAEWQETLTQLLATYFGEGGDEDGRVQRVRDALADLAAQAAPDTPDQPGDQIPLALVRYWLGERLGSTSRRGRYFRGGVTFCGMRPMRSLPFQVICMLGLNDRAFPRRDHPVELDLMSRAWRPGDPRKGDEDRYLFLETLLCARRRLYLSYVGRDLRNNSERQPSVLLQELRDAVDQRYCLPPDLAQGQQPGDQPQPLSPALIREAPMQPFSPRNYLSEAAGAGGPGRGIGPSFDAGWCDLARASLMAARPRPAADPPAGAWPDTRLPEAPDALRQVGLIQLERWLRHPIKHFINTRLQIYLREEAIEPDDEPFALDPLQHFGLKRRLIECLLRGLAGAGGGGELAMDDRVRGVRALSARGDLPHGAFAALTYTAALDEVTPLLAQIERYRGVAPVQVPVDLAFAPQGRESPPAGGMPTGDPEAGLGQPDGPTRLIGQIPDLYPGLGLLRVRPAKLNGVDILALWLHHLAWCAAAPHPDGGRRESRLICADQAFVLAGDLVPETARAALARLLHWYWAGLHRPLPILPRSSYACARALREGKDPTGAVATAWAGNRFQGPPGEREDAYVRLVLRGRDLDPLAVPEFTDLAQALYAQVLDREVA